MIRLARDSKFAPCGFIVMRAPFDMRDEPNTVLFQTDWDFPGLAQTFGWSLSKRQNPGHEFCEHSGTDGTVTCPDCGLTPDMMISAAMDYLDDIANTELEVEDPGYFPEPCEV